MCSVWAFTTYTTFAAYSINTAPNWPTEYQLQRVVHEGGVERERDTQLTNADGSSGGALVGLGIVDQHQAQLVVQLNDPVQPVVGGRAAHLGLASQDAGGRGLGSGWRGRGGHGARWAGGGQWPAQRRGQQGRPQPCKHAAAAAEEEGSGGAEGLLGTAAAVVVVVVAR